MVALNFQMPGTLSSLHCHIAVLFYSLHTILTIFRLYCRYRVWDYSSCCHLHSLGHNFFMILLVFLHVFVLLLSLFFFLFLSSCCFFLPSFSSVNLSLSSSCPFLLLSSSLLQDQKLSRTFQSSGRMATPATYSSLSVIHTMAHRRHSRKHIAAARQEEEAL